MRERITAIIVCLFLIGGLPLRGAYADAQPQPTNTPVLATAYSQEQWDGLPRLVAQWEWYQAVLMAEWYDDYNARQGDKDAIHRVIGRVWGPDSVWADIIVQRESEFNPGATNASSGACGLFQMLGHEDMFIAAGYRGNCHDAVANIEVAYKLFQGSGKGPWRL